MNGNMVEGRSRGDQCGDFEWMVGPLLDGELPRGERARVQEHLDGCEACRELADSFRNLDRLARGSLGNAPGVSGQEWGLLWHSIQERVELAPFEERRSAWRWIIPSVAAAALLVLGLWLGHQIFEGEDSTRDLPRRAETPAEELPRDQRTLPEMWQVEDANVIDFSG